MVMSTSRLALPLEPAQPARELMRLLPLELACELAPEWLARVEATTESGSWLHGFFIRLVSLSDCEIGSIGFKDPPDSEGDVEVAYAIEEAHQMWLPFVGEVTDRVDGQVWRWERVVAPNE